MNHYLVIAIDHASNSERHLWLLHDSFFLISFSLFLNAHSQDIQPGVGLIFFFFWFNPHKVVLNLIIRSNI